METRRSLCRVCLLRHTDPTYKEWKPIIYIVVKFLLDHFDTDPTYKEWKQNRPPTPAIPAAIHGSYLQGMETLIL